MKTRMRCWLFVFCLAWVGSSLGAEPLHQRIDAIMAAAHDGPIAPRSSDAEFLRRISLDLAGVIPHAAEARKFISDQSIDKRPVLIDRLLSEKNFSRRMQQAFSVMLLERRSGTTIAMEDWEEYLRSSFENNKPLDRLISELLSADGTDPATRSAMKFFLARSATDHRLLARDVSRLLLGRNLECAQCHDHPTVVDYKQSEFFGLVAFLDRSYLYRDKKTNQSFLIEKGLGKPLEFTSVFTSESKKTGPQLLGGAMIEVPVFEEGKELQEASDKGGPPLPKFALRPLLAKQLTSQNRAFNRNLANRLWAMMMGLGVVSPLDMQHPANPASHPKLLDVLADELVSLKFDIRRFLRELALSETYHRSSLLGDVADGVAPQSFAVFNMKPLSAEQLAFSLMRVTGSEKAVMATPADKAATKKYRPDKGRPIPAENLDNVLKLVRSVYAAQPGRSEDDFSPAVAAALFSENERLLLRWLTPEKGTFIDRLSKLKEPDAIAEELYLAIFTRRPSDEERASVQKYLAESSDGREVALREMAWALLASSEFRFNH